MALPSDLEPVPVEGCAVCEAADRFRNRARALAGPLGVRFANETITEHPHTARVEAES